MTNISYYGLSMVADEALEKRVANTIKKLLPTDGIFNFYFHTRYPDQLSADTLSAVLRIKAERNDLCIRTILVVTDTKVEDPGFDEIVVAPNMSEGAYFLTNVKRAKKWIIEQADYLFMYLYPSIYNGDRDVLACIQNRVKAGKLSLLNIADDRLSSLIAEQIPKLRERLRFVHEEVMSGKTFRELAEEMSVTPRRARDLFNESCRALRILTYQALIKKQNPTSK